MPQRLMELLRSFVERFAAIDLTQKVIVGTVLVFMVLVGAYLFRQAQEDYDVLYSNMSLPDAAATVAKLREVGTPYKLVDAGRTVLVPRDKKNQLLLDTANELTSNDPISLTKIPPVLQGDVQKEWLKKFNSDTIAHTLESIRGIHNARVLISQPEDTVFRDEKEEVRASVMLVVDPGFRLKEGQIKTIKNLVAHAVPGLSIDGVAISDNFGNSLEDISASGGIISDNESKRKTFELETKRKIEELLKPLVGRDNAVVSVSADFNFDRARAKIHKVIPSAKGENGESEQGSTAGLIISRQQQSEEYQGGSKGEGGAVGIASNASPTVKTTTYQGASSGGEKRDYRSEKTTTNYVHSEEDREVIYAAGKIERLSVGVILNKVLTESEQTELKDMIASAAGINFDRGDSLQIKGFKFSEGANEKAQKLSAAYEEAQQQEFWLQLGYLLVVGLLGLAGVTVFYNLMKRPPSEAELVEEEEYAYDEEGQPMVISRNEAGQMVVIRQPAPEPQLVDMQMGGPINIERVNAIANQMKGIPELDATRNAEVEFMKQAIDKTVSEDPAEAARVLVSFMKDVD